ncbi:MAG: SLBB domain-containing protein [Cyanobacteria bacterium P01_G01_bin.54]
MKNPSLAIATVITLTGLGLPATAVPVSKTLVSNIDFAQREREHPVGAGLKPAPTPQFLDSALQFGEDLSTEEKCIEPTSGLNPPGCADPLRKGVIAEPLLSLPSSQPPAASPPLPRGAGGISPLAQVPDFEETRIDGEPILDPPGGRPIDPVETVEPLEEQFDLRPQRPPTQSRPPTSEDAFIPVTPSSNSSRFQPLPAGALLLETAYTLGGGDVLQINVFDVPEYTGQYTVGIDGTINMPLLGEVLVGGATIAQVNQYLQAAYSEYLVRPFVNTTLIAFRAVNIVIAGEVARPGNYTNIESSTNRRFLTVVEALELADGVTLSADIRNVQLRRRSQGLEQVYRLNLWEFLQNGDARQNVTLRDGDSLFVPAATVTDPVDIQVLLDASFAPNVLQPIPVAIAGEVNRPGTYVVASGNVPGAAQPPTVTEAIARAGGIKTSADVRNIRLRRRDRWGNEEILDINLWALIREGDITQDMVLQPNDAIVIPRAEVLNPEETLAIATASFSPEQIQVSVIGEVTGPGRLTLPPNSTLNQGIFAAGGFNQSRAKKGFVDLIRLNPDGSVTNRKIDVDFAVGLNDENNPLLRNGDVIVVRRNALTGFSDVLTSILRPVSDTFGALNFLRIFGILETD